MSFLNFLQLLLQIAKVVLSVNDDVAYSGELDVILMLFYSNEINQFVRIPTVQLHFTIYLELYFTICFYQLNFPGFGCLSLLLLHNFLLLDVPILRIKCCLDDICPPTHINQFLYCQRSVECSKVSVVFPCPIIHKLLIMI